MEKRKINLEPIHTFLTTDTSPTLFSDLLDEFVHDYMTMLVRIQLSGDIDKSIHEKTDLFLFYIRSFREVLGYCVK